MTPLPKKWNYRALEIQISEKKIKEAGVKIEGKNEEIEETQALMDEREPKIWKPKRRNWK